MERKKRQGEAEVKVEGKGEHKCPICPRRFVQRSSLFRHIYQVHPNYKHNLVCKFCKKTCTSRSGLTRHLKKVSTTTITSS
mmetsp:Transcript_13555/g.20373  ORF Transcript_13555/g.20373 Transcript_13555/m.20373 type:complete len:81 (+) Transcript_13555:143-385(+)